MVNTVCARLESVVKDLSDLSHSLVALKTDVDSIVGMTKNTLGGSTNNFAHQAVNSAVGYSRALEGAIDMVSEIKESIEQFLMKTKALDSVIFNG